ncbi:MAG TPA: HD domain-containing phosphohydrolase, partial [Clostridia bacterium]|nr:HD domain-containing phosphohydrolase [Clostridia bacterium]
MLVRSPATGSTHRAGHWPDALVVLGLLVPASFVPLAVSGGGSLLVVPYQHFYIVSAVSIVAALVAAALALTTIQIGLYRVLFLCLGFMSLCAIFAVHGLTTPGVLVPNLFREYSGSAVAISAYLSLAVPALFFAVSYMPGLARLERRLPFWPAGWLVVLVIGMLLGYAGIAIYRTWLIAQLPLSQPPYSTGLAILSIVLFFFAAMRQARSYRRARLATQAFLLAAFVLLADAAAAMVLFPVWTYGWWYYHLLMLAAVVLALYALMVERSRARSFRSVIETALELEVSVDVEELDFEVIAALVAAVEVKDRETQGHNRRVAQLCAQIGRQMGMSATELRVLARSGLLHDVGKLGIPDAILEKHGPLDESEMTVMKTHPEIGVSILRRGGHFKRELLGVLYHHERMDGSGYPHGLVNEAIPIEARIVAVADTYDVLTSDRPYRHACGGREARRVVEEEAGTHLDPRVVVALMRVLDKHGSASSPGRKARGPAAKITGEKA